MKLLKVLALSIIAISLVGAIEFSYELPVKKISCFGDSLGEMITVLISLDSPNPNFQFRVYDPEGKQAFNITEEVTSNKRLLIDLVTIQTNFKISKIEKLMNESKYINLLQQINQILQQLNIKFEEQNLKLVFVTQKEGNYQFCFTNLEPIPLKFKFTYKTGVEAKDYTELTTKDDFKPIDLQVKKMEDMLSSIQKEKRMISRRAKTIRRSSDDVGFKVIAFSIITLILMALLTAFQVIYLKNFFKTKKLI